MRLFVDENLGHTIGRWLREQGHDVFAVIESCRGARDPDLLRQAAADGRVIVTADKGFGELVFRARLPHAGVILLRMGDRTAADRIAVLSRVLVEFEGRIEGSFIVATEDSIRLRETPTN